MKAISIRQPWAWLIVQGCKDIENRRWSSHYRGPLYIHASKAMDSDEYENAQKVARSIDPNIVIPHMTHLKYGGIIGKVNMVDCTKEHASKWFFGPYGFVLRNPRPVNFYPVDGQLGLFNVNIEDEQADRTRRQVMAARARAMAGTKVTFKMEINGVLQDVSGYVETAKVGEIHEPSGLLGYTVQVRGKSGRLVEIDSNETFMKVHWGTKNR